MKKKWGYGIVAVCGIVLAGCSTGSTSSTGESNTSGSGSAAAEQVFNVNALKLNA